MEFRIKQAWALQCDPDEIKCNQDEGRATILQAELYTLIFLKYWLGMWIWIKDLGSVSANLQWDLEHIHFFFTLTGSGVCKLYIGSLVHQELWPEKVMATSCCQGLLMEEVLFQRNPGALKVHLAAMAQLGRCYLCLSFLNSERNFWWHRLSLPPMGSGALFVCGLGHLIKVW